MIKLKDLLKENNIEKYQYSALTSNTLDDFLKSLVGKKIKDLLDCASFSRLYVGNKYGTGNVDEADVDVLLSRLLSLISSYINNSKLEPIRKQREEWDKIENEKSDNIEYRKKRAAAFKAILAARQSGDKDAEQKAYKDKQEIEKSDTGIVRYRQMMDDMKTIVNQIHNTPLTLKDIMDSVSDKKTYDDINKVFNDFKNKMSS